MLVSSFQSAGFIYLCPDRCWFNSLSICNLDYCKPLLAHLPLHTRIHLILSYSSSHLKQWCLHVTLAAITGPATSYLKALILHQMPSSTAQLDHHLLGNANLLRQNSLRECFSSAFSPAIAYKGHRIMNMCMQFGHGKPFPEASNTRVVGWCCLQMCSTIQNTWLFRAELVHCVWAN